ncbi:MAG TPA: hypothetical protein VG122_06590, partial [Gemmata sp.]|nr:hypothetical protein [Gemmata sp.]
CPGLSVCTQQPLMTTPFVITVDTEEEWDWSSGYPTGPTRTANIHRLPDFQTACERHGAAVTYFVNHAVLIDPVARDVILQLSRRPRVEIGMHIHPWNTPPLQPVEKVPTRDSFLHNLPPELAIAKLNTVYAAFRDCGLAPISFRGGRYSTGPLIQNWLRERGFVADVSVLPYTRWVDDGAPDYHDRGPQPSRLLGSPPLWELPLSLAFTRRPFGFWNRVLSTAEKPPLRYLRVVGVLQKLGVFRKSWLNFENPFWEGMRALIRSLLRAHVPYLCFTVHSSSLLLGGSPYATSPADVDRLFARLNDALNWLAGDAAFVPATIADIARRLEAEHASNRDQPAG